jgi:hypothetical protein
MGQSGTIEGLYQSRPDSGFVRRNHADPRRGLTKMTRTLGVAVTGQVVAVTGEVKSW